MPELPEVETLRRGLERSILNWRIADAAIVNAKVLKGQSEADFRERILGKRIEQVNRRGKYLLVPLRGSEISSSSISSQNPHSPVLLCIHLKMRGQLRVCQVSDAEAENFTANETAKANSPYLCIRLLLRDEEKPERGEPVELRFEDMWTWGEMRALTMEEAAKLPGLAKMGAEPLDSDWDGAALARKLSGRKGPIKPALLDQTVVAGVGNIYADESLFRSGIHPERVAGSLSDGETQALATTIQIVLTEALNGGGTTSEDYTDVEGVAGRYTPRVYDRGGAPCLVCGTALTRIRLGGRGTVYCSACQN